MKHRYGDCFLKDGYAYVHIPKNASCLVKIYWDGAEQLNYNDSPLPKDSRIVVVLRDPVDRWLSGYAQTAHTLIDNLADINWKTVFSKIDYDNHTAPQHKFIEGLDHNQIDFFSNIGIKQALDEYLPFENDINLDALRPLLNISSDDPHKNSIIECAKMQLKLEPKYLEHLKEYYARDYELINTVDFYRGLHAK